MAEFNSGQPRAISEIQALSNTLERKSSPSRINAMRWGGRSFKRCCAKGVDRAGAGAEFWRSNAELRREQEIFADSGGQNRPNPKTGRGFKAIQKGTFPRRGVGFRTLGEPGGDPRVRRPPQIVTLPSEVRVRVRGNPQYARATSFASMDTPVLRKPKRGGVLLCHAGGKEWPPKQAEEWLTAFNVLYPDVVSIHEAYPDTTRSFSA